MTTPTEPDLSRLLAALRQLLEVIDSIGGHMTHEQQAAVRVARMLVANLSPQGG